jgi:hypothetical protein
MSGKVTEFYTPRTGRRGVDALDEQTITASLLRKLMSGISEEYWCAGWLAGLEYTLWNAITGKRKNVCSSEEIDS